MQLNKINTLNNINKLLNNERKLLLDLCQTYDPYDISQNNIVIWNSDFSVLKQQKNKNDRLETQREKIIQQMISNNNKNTLKSSNDIK